MAKEYSGDLFAAVSNSATSLVKLLGYVNGTSAVALLAFIGHLATSSDPALPILPLLFPLLLFLIGLVMTLLTGGFVFFATDSAAKSLYKEDDKEKESATQKRKIYKKWARWTGIVSLGVFIGGCIWLIVIFLH